MAVGFVASASSGSQASVATFNIGTLGTGARAGIVFVCIHNSATDIISGVTWNGAAMTRLFSAIDTNTEPGVTIAFFLDNVTNGTITVSRTNNAVVTVGYAASISTASLPAYVSQVITVGGGGTVVTNNNASEAGTAASGEVAVDDGSPGTNSMRFAAAFSGAATPPLQGTNSTNLQVLDSTAFGSRFVCETTAGQGSRSVGFATGTTDDWALVAVAVSEAGPKTVTLGLLTSTSALYAPTVTPAPVTVTLGLLNASAALYAPTISLAPYPITVPLLDAGATLYAPTLTPKNTLTIGFLDASNALYAPTLTQATPSQSITLGLLDASNALYAPTLAPQPVTITLGLLDASNALYAPTLATTNSVILDLLDAGPALYAPTVVPSAVSITVPFLDAGPTLYEPTLSIGSVTISLGLLDAGNALYAPSISQAAGSSQGITLGLLDASAALYAPTLTVGAIGVTLPLLDAGAVLYAPTVANSLSIVTLPLLDSGWALYAPTVAIAGEGGGPGKHTPRRRGPRMAPAQALVAVTAVVDVTVPAPTVSIIAEVNDDEVVLELLASLL